MDNNARPLVRIDAGRVRQLLDTLIAVTVRACEERGGPGHHAAIIARDEARRRILDELGIDSPT